MATRVVILSDDGGRESEWVELVRAAGGWIVATGAPGIVPDILQDAELIVADLRGFDAFETFLHSEAAMIAEIDVDAIDAAAGLLPRAQLLIDPDPIERAAAIAVALAEGGGGVRESASLRQLSEEAGRIARVLAELAADGRAVAHPPAPGSASAPAITARLVRSVIRQRRLRERFFAAEIFADPAWDILLDLYAARLEGTQVAVSSLCIAASVPPTTALRWIRGLTEQGLLVRVEDPADRRRMFVALSAGAADRMAAYFAASES